MDNILTVSAVCTTYNCREGLRKTILQLLKEVDGKRILELVVVDGGSTDGTWEALQELGLASTHLRIIQEEGANISRGRNIAVKHSRGNIILSFDSGCGFVDGFIAMMIDPFEKDPECDVTGAKTICVGSTFFERAVAFLQHGTHKDHFNPSSRGIAFRRQVFNAIGGYDESVMAGEDSDFNLKWRNRGYKYVLVNQAIVYWRVRSSLPALYWMQLRNTTGSDTLGLPWNKAAWAIRLNIVLLVVGLLSAILAAGGWTWLWWPASIGLGGWFAYVLFRTMSRGRYRWFLNPVYFIYAVCAMAAMDLGTWAGTFNARIVRIRRRRKSL